MQPTREPGRTATALRRSAAAVLVATVCGAPAAAQVRTVVHATGFSAPVAMVYHPGAADAQLIVEQAGRVRVIAGGVVQSAPFLDLSAAVATGGERGLLGLAFAPDYQTSRRVFVNFTNVQGHTVIARFLTFANNPLVADPATRFDLRWGGAGGLRHIVQPFANHNGGDLAFGPDGYLYIGLGDGGSGGDPLNHAQNPSSLLGKMLRIDVSVANDDADGYRVPVDNPFVSGGALPEIWAFGLRNPWRYSFDSSGPGGAGTGALVIGDVGQGAREEINYEPAGRSGRNYGWRLREGSLPYLPETAPATLPLTEPLLDYDRSLGRSVTGGLVYRGLALRSGFRGRYFYADFITGRVWSVGVSLSSSGEASVIDRVEHTSELGGSSHLGSISAFGRDSRGEVYLVSYAGTIFKVVDDPVASGPIGGTPGASAPPFGQVDTPAAAATNVVGAIGVTGWALDDGLVTGVRIYRNCFAFDNPASCQSVAGHLVVFIGDAVFVPGARPDVAAAYPTYPNANGAGWGLLVLTNSLPHIPNQQVFGGQGTVTLYAVAADADGQLTLLGRSSVDHTPTTVTLTNDTIAKPFGTLDTPAQGGTVAGAFTVFGWALTPDRDAVANADDILIPRDGSTIRVFVDGVALGTVASNLCRGTVGSPVPAGAYCDDDVANVFGQPSPQPTLTPRTSNPTRFRNLDAGGGAIGAYTIDTTTLTNGLHSIAWSVTDSAGRVEGIGSRNFVVANGGADAAAIEPAPSSAQRSTMPPGLVSARSGFDLSAAWTGLALDDERVARVRLDVPDRLEVDFGEPLHGANLVVDDALTSLPVGAHLSGGAFTWAPPAGYLGSYTLRFQRPAGPLDLLVEIRPREPTAAGLQMWVDATPTGAWVNGARAIRISGEARDSDAFAFAGVSAVHVWARRLDMPTLTPQFIGAATLEARDRRGRFHLDGALTAGRYEVTAYAWCTRTGRWEDARTVTVTITR